MQQINRSRLRVSAARPGRRASPTGTGTPQSRLERASAYGEVLARAGFFFSAVFLAAAAAYGLFLSGRTEAIAVSLLARGDALARDAGLGIETVSIAGLNRLPRQAVLETLSLPTERSILSYDTRLAMERLMAQGWVRSAEVRKRFPSSLDVTITERVPFARYADGEAIVLIDFSGARLGAAFGETFDSLLLVAGEGSPENAPALIEALSSREDLRVQIARAEFVERQFWTLRLKRGIDVKLPRKVGAIALDRLETLLTSEKLTAMDLRSIDLRVANRTVLQLKDATIPNREASIAFLAPAALNTSPARRTSTLPAERKAKAL